MTAIRADARWELNKDTWGFLVALDISGFSIDVDPDELLNHRMNFFRAVEQAPLFPKARDQQTVKVHILGDELRLAFRAEVGAPEVRDFIVDIFSGLDRINRNVPEPLQTRIKGAVLEGSVTWREWRGCVFLNGDLPIQAQKWMGQLKSGEVAINPRFRESLKTAGAPVDFAEKELFGETGYILRG